MPFGIGEPRRIDANGGQPMGPRGIPLARPGHPVTLPSHEEPIKCGLPPETGGTFKVFNYQDYFDKKPIDEFGKKYGVTMELTTFDSMDQAITRVALARDQVLKPSVLVLDEPAGAPDAKLRKQLQLELKALQQQVGITFIYVTHDQEEALTMSDRIAVMSHGRVEQVA